MKDLSKTEQAYEKLEAMITFQELTPGTMQSEATLMAMTGMGRAPVREALQRLAAERMVDIHPRRGIFIPLISVEVQLKLLELRRAVEELAVRLATHRAGMHEKDAMLKLADELAEVTGEEDLQQFGALLKKVHRTIVQASRNEYFPLTMAPLQGLSRRFWFANMRDRKTELRRGASLHATTLLAVCHGDENAAAAGSLALNDYLTEFAYRSLRPS